MFDESGEPCSDVAHFKDGLRWAYAATEWELVTGPPSRESPSDGAVP